MDIVGSERIKQKPPWTIVAPESPEKMLARILEMKLGLSPASDIPSAFSHIAD
jgi:hypothetical protein